MTETGGLSFDEHGYVDMDQVPDVDLDPTELADLQASLAGVPPEVVDARGWDELVQTAIDDAQLVDDDLIPDDGETPGPSWDSPADTPSASEWHQDGEQEDDDPEADHPGDLPTTGGGNGYDDEPLGWDHGDDIVDHGDHDGAVDLDDD